MNLTRSELKAADATMNQLRNAIYHLGRFMGKNGVEDLATRFHQMGRNIAKTYYAYWNPIEMVSLNNIRDVIATIYKEILNSSVGVEINNTEKVIVVRDSGCALCKYHYEDIEIAGCEILLGLISEYINQINLHSKKNPEIFIEPLNVQESRAYGNKSCIQIFKYKRSET
ncbi:MAG: hypothetical protein BAJALOKI1v1_1380009 [Promethearchaeota archaeon]|nr:MAG: hypothetical protein BAJALOKI1v1_1380009 [Candidatus Lokiarchaeota archaeon]